MYFEKNQKYKKETNRQNLLYILNTSTILVIQFIGTVIIWVVGAQEVFKGNMTIGTIMALMNYQTIIMNPIIGIAQFANEYHTAVVSLTTDGGIYTCAELPEFKIGSVEAGLDVPRIREIIYLEDQEDTMCKKCQYIRHCKTRGCQVANYEIHQNVYQPIKVNCEVTKWMYHLIQTNLTEKQLEKLKQEYERRYLRHGK